MSDLVKSPLVILSFLLALLLITGWGTYNIVYRAFSFYKESRETESKIQGLLKNKDKLESDLRELQSQSAVAREAKNRLNLKSPGEEVLVVVDDKKNGTTTYGGVRGLMGGKLRMFLDKLREFLPR